MAAVVFGVQQGWFFAWCKIYIKIYLGVRGGASRPHCSNGDLMGYLVQHIYCKVLQLLVLMLLHMTAAIALSPCTLACAFGGHEISVLCPVTY